MVDISIVIPTYNRLEQLKTVLRALEEQRYPRDGFEVVVVSDGSRDGTDEYLASASPNFPLRFIAQDNSGPAAARNLGAAGASGALLLFLDDDVVPDPDLLQKHADSHSETAPTNLVIGPMLTPADWTLSPWVAWEQTLLERYYRHLTTGLYPPTSRLFYTGNASLKRDFFFLNGRFDTQFSRAEDVEFAYRAERNGAKFVFNSAAKGYHYARRSYESWLRIAYQYGQNDVRFTREKGVDWLLPQLLKELKQRSFLWQIILRLFLDRERSQAVMIDWLKVTGVRFYRPRGSLVSRAAFSLIFNLRYYQGMADQLGSAAEFFSLVRQA